MTCKEKLAHDNPTWDEEDVAITIKEECPHMNIDTIDMPDYCDSGQEPETCAKCWAREVPTEKKIKASAIKDSGDRTRFDTGAVRDMREGKGRCDLMPIEVAAALLGDIQRNPDPILASIKMFQKTSDTHWLYVALEHISEKWFGGCNCTMLLEVAKHFEEGAKKYGENNWQKGIPTYCYIDSAVRHYLKVLREDSDEPHIRALVWNLMCCIWEVDYGPNGHDKTYKLAKEEN